MSAYLVKKTAVNPTPADDFDSPVWSQAGIIELKNRYMGDKPEHGFTRTPPAASFTETGSFSVVTGCRTAIF